MVITKNVHPAIVSEEEYEIAKATIAFMKKPDYRGARKFALKGKVRCGNCRRSMVLMESVLMTEYIARIKDDREICQVFR